jgi:Dolichyl-phosphate-mannose-protein mannosyltransferase
MFVGMKLLLGLTRDATSIWRSSLFAVRLTALVMASVAFAAVLYVTEPPGPGLQESSAAYLGAAESMARGQGFHVPEASWSSADSTSPLTRYPPGYSAALTLPVLAGLPPVQAARLVQAISAFVAMATLVAIVGDASGAGVAVLLGLALLVAPPLVNAHLSVLSEPLFLACLALTLAAMVLMPEEPIAAGVCAGATFLVRYAGISAVIAVVLWALAQGGSWRARVGRAVLAVVPTLVLAGVWLSTTRGVGPALVRRFGVHPGLGQAVATGWATITHWLVPSGQAVSWGVWLALPVATGLVAVLVSGSRRAYRSWRLLPPGVLMQSSSIIPQLIGARVLGDSALLAGVYVVVLVAARVFAAGGIAFDDRLVSPLVMLGSVAFAVGAASWWRTALRSWRVALGVALAVWGIAAAAASWRQAHDALAHGAGLANDAWRRSPTLEWARNDGVRYAVYSNWPGLGYLYLGRPAHGLPATDDSATLRAFTDTLAARRGVVLVFLAPNERYPIADSLTRGGGLRVVAAFPDGRVLGPAQR